MDQNPAGQGQRTCPICGNVAPPMARFCPSCGARFSQPLDSSQSFEDAIASVLGEDAPAGAPPEPDAPPDVDDWAAPPPETPPPSAASSPSGATGGWATTPTSAGGWGPTYVPTQTSPGRRRVLWIVLTIFGFLTFCCCGFVFFSVAVA